MGKRASSLCVAINKFYGAADKLTKYAALNLETDMAHRIMYGIIEKYRPNEFDPSTGQTFKSIDFPAAFIAVDGARRLILYGTKVCADEIAAAKKEYIPTHYLLREKEPPSAEKIETIFLPLLKQFSYIFANMQNWDTEFGGRPWKNISDALIQICLGYIEYSKSKKYSPEQEAAIRKTLVSMNLFDQLCHNTAPIMKKMLRIEGKPPSGILKVINMMNAKELNSPAQTFKIIENSLDTDLPYKDYVGQIKSSDEYKSFEEEKVEKELEEIKKSRNLKIDLTRQKYIQPITKLIENTRKLYDFVFEIRHKMHNINEYNREIKHLVERSSFLIEVRIPNLMNAIATSKMFKINAAALTDFQKMIVSAKQTMFAVRGLLNKKDVDIKTDSEYANCSNLLANLANDIDEPIKNAEDDLIKAITWV